LVFFPLEGNIILVERIKSSVGERVVRERRKNLKGLKRAEAHSLVCREA
jgi:hypothetical protein